MNIVLLQPASGTKNGPRDTAGQGTKPACGKVSMKFETRHDVLSPSCASVFLFAAAAAAALIFFRRLATQDAGEDAYAGVGGRYQKTPPAVRSRDQYTSPSECPPGPRSAGPLDPFC